MIYEVIAIWEGEFYMHQALTLEDAQGWVDAYKDNKNYHTRLWYRNA